jgi:hypothetical protein
MSIKRNGCPLYKVGRICQSNGKECNYIPKKCNKLANKITAHTTARGRGIGE